MLFSLPLLLSACQFNPIATSAQTQPASPAQQPTAPTAPAANPSVSTSSVSGFSKQSVTFHDKAKYNPLHFLQQLPKGKQSLPLRFVSKNPGKGKYTIRMPENTLFRVVFKAGPRFEILDNDARDGQAVVQMPSELREGYTRVRSPRSKELLRTLTLKDPLYKLTQELVRNDEGPGSFLLTANPPRPSTPLRAHLKPLQISSVCSEEPDEYRLWKIENPNNQPVPYGWEVEGSSQTGNEVAPPGESYFESETQNGNNKVTLTVAGKKEINRVSLPTQCREGEEPGVSIWWKLGVRPFPIPASWNAGSDYTLEFQPQNIPAFTLRWIKSQASAPDFPPGLAEIGPAGGNVDLPGVAKLAVPAGAVSQKTLFRISQVSQAMGLQTQCESRILASESCVPGFDFASALVKLEPFKLQLNTPASLTLAIDSARLGTNHPGTLRYKANQTSGLDPESWVFDPLLAPASGSALSATTQTAIPVKTLAHVAAFMPVLVQPQDGFVPVQNGNLLLSEKESSVSNADALALLNQLSGALGYYSSLGLPSPVGGQHEWQSGPVLPVTVMKACALAGVSEVFGRSLVAGPPEKEQIAPSSKFLGSKILLRQCIGDGENCGGYAVQETVAKDAFHLVQQSYYRDAAGHNENLNYAKYIQGLETPADVPNYEDRWFVLGIAQVMGTLYTKQTLTPTQLQEAPVFRKTQESLSNLYHSVFKTGEMSALLPLRPADLPVDPDDVEAETQTGTFPSYKRDFATAFFSHLALNPAYGPTTLVELVKKRGILLTSPDTNSLLSPSLKAFQQTLPLSDAYLAFARDVLFKRQLNFFPALPWQDDLDDISADTLNFNTAILTKEHTADQPLLIPLELGPLATEYYRVLADSSLPGNKTISLRFKTNGSQVFLKAAWLKAHTAEDASQNLFLSEFQEVTLQEQEIQGFGSAEQLNSLVLSLSNTFSQNKNVEQATLRGELEIYYKPIQGEPQWQAPLPSNFTVGEAAPLLHNGLLYLVGPGGQIVAQKTDSGQTEWQRSLPTPLSASPALGPDGSLYVGGINGTFYAMNPDGSTRWRFTPDEPNSFRLGGVALDEGKGVLYTGGTAETIYALNIQTGQEVWRFQARAPIDSAPIIGKEQIYVLALDQTLYALDKATGKYLWEFQTGQPISDITPALTGDGNIIFGSSDTWLYNVSQNGLENWSYVMAGALSASPVIGPEGNVYAPCADGRLYALDDRGNLLWRFEAGSAIQAAPVVGQEGKVYIGSSQGRIVSINPDGSKDWEKSVSGAVRGRLVLDSQGFLYGNTDQGQSFAFQTGNQGLAQSGWPIEHGHLLGWGRKP